MSVYKFVNYDNSVFEIAIKYGWLPGVRYDSLSKLKDIDRVGFIDIKWEKYNYKKHLEAVKNIEPLMTVARDIKRKKSLDRIIDEAWELSNYSKYVIIVPKDPLLADDLDKIPGGFILGYSVPTRYGGTGIPPRFFNRDVHLLGGRPDIQRGLAESMPVFSLDCNRFTLDATYGDYFDGETFRPHPIGGFGVCVKDSIININRLWNGYSYSGGENND